MRIKTGIASTVGALALMVAVGTGPALAHYCTTANKQAGAGSMGIYNVATESFTPAQRGGAFVTFTDGQTFSYDVYMHNLLPDGALAAGPGGDDECDGRGIDNALDCLGIPH